MINKGGRPKGSLNKSTLARRRAAEAAMESAKKIAVEYCPALDLMKPFLPILAEMAQYFRPTYPGMPHQNRHGNHKEFERWFLIFLKAFEAYAPYESPTLRAVYVSAQRSPLNEAMAMLLDEIDRESRQQERKQQQVIELQAN